VGFVQSGQVVSIGNIAGRLELEIEVKAVGLFSVSGLSLA